MRDFILHAGYWVSVFAIMGFIIGSMMGYDLSELQYKVWAFCCAGAVLLAAQVQDPILPTEGE